MVECERASTNFFSKTDPTYIKLQQSLDARMKSLTKDGVGVHPKKAAPVEVDEEGIFWQKVSLT